MLRALGGTLIATATAIFCGGYASYLRRGAAESRAFLDYLTDKRRRIANYNDGSRAVDWGADALEELGFFPLLRAGASSARAMEEVADKTAAPREVVARLREYFSLCGGDYMEGELDLLDRTTVELRRLTEELESALPGRIRVAYTLGLALGVGLFLLLI